LSNARDLTHLTAERIQGFLDGLLPAREVADVQQHVTSCSRCRSDLEAWQMLFSELGDLEQLEPAESLRQAILAGLESAAERQLDALLDAIERFSPSPTFAARVMAEWRSRASTASTRVADVEVEALLSGLGHYQPEPAFAARVMEDWRSEKAGQAALEIEIDGVFAGLGQFQPSPAFSQLVMAKVDVGGLVRQAASTQPVPLAALVRRAGAFAGRMVPRTKHAWAVISGVAVTPASVVALLAYAIFSNPLATPANLAQFAWWRVASAGSMLGGSVQGFFLDSTLAIQGYSAFEYVASSPLVAAGGALSFALLTCGALWVLYKNLIPTSAVEQGYARIAA
jgi:Putative zinc-finger